ncbi:acr-15 [Aphelenchoides avenae]|nr:acr-15 [Aphelenchus avenae]
MTPRTSEAVPLLGIFFQSCMVISVLATAFTVYVQNVHFRTKNHQPMGFWVLIQRSILRANNSVQMRYILLELAPYVLRIHQPMRENTLRTLRNSLQGHRHSKCDPGMRTKLSYDNDKAVATARFDVTCKPCLQAFVDYLRRSNVKGDAETADQLSELERIYSQIKMIRQSNDDSREEDRIKKEFHFAAIVVDRLGLMLFTLIMFSTAAAIVLKAPYLIA